MSFLAPTPTVPNIPIPPPPPPQPDVNAIKNGISQQEALSRKPKGVSGNILTGSLGNVNNLGSASKNLLGQ